MADLCDWFSSIADYYTGLESGISLIGYFQYRQKDDRPELIEGEDDKEIDLLWKYGVFFKCPDLEAEYLVSVII
jgi:hypothetical protein